MPFPRKLLNDEETIAVDLHPHWSYLVAPALAVVVSVVAGVATLVATDGGSTIRAVLGWCSVLALVASAWWLVVRYLGWATTNFVVTTDRIIQRSGVVAKRGVEIPLERVNTVHFRQSVLERLTGSGELVIESGGEHGRQRFHHIRRPVRVQREIHRQMDVAQRRRSAVRGGSSADIAGQLERLEAMFERGTLSREEFQAQKARLLGGRTAGEWS